MTAGTAEFADALLSLELPSLPDDRRQQTVRFIVRRVAALPAPVGVGVSAAALAVHAAGYIAGHGRVVRTLATRPLPVLGDYVRLVRSLGFAYVWETWPGTQPDGAPA